MKLQVEIFDTVGGEVDQGSLRAVVQHVWAEEARQEARINIILVDENYIQHLNREYLENDNLTDVIAFPVSDDHEAFFEGEIYVCLPQVEAQAQTFEVSATEELHRVVIHGVLHFLGYEDANPDDKALMSRKEDFYLAQVKKELDQVVH